MRNGLTTCEPPTSNTGFLQILFYVKWELSPNSVGVAMWATRVNFVYSRSL